MRYLEILALAYIYCFTDTTRKRLSKFAVSFSASNSKSQCKSSNVHILSNVLIKTPRSLRQIHYV